MMKILAIIALALVPVVTFSAEVYVDEIDVKQDLDCTSSLSEDEKANKLRMLYRDKRVKFTNKVISIDDNELTLSGMLGTGVFTGMPTVTLRDIKLLKSLSIVEGKVYKFDCKIVDFCRKGTFFNRSLRFGDCLATP